MITTTDFGYEVRDHTEDKSTGSISTTYYFKTTWTKDLQIINLFTNISGAGFYKSEYRRQDLLNLDKREKLAISRHKKEIEEMLNPKEKKLIKIIEINYLAGLSFFTHMLEEKKTTYVGDGMRIDKSNCIIWTPKRQEIINEIEKLQDDHKQKIKILLNSLM
jgi:hypothetical protein